MRLRQVLGVIALAVATLAGQACGHASARLPSWCPNGSCAGIPADAPRHALIGTTGTCVWLEIDGVRGSAKWPPGFTATFGPLVVYDPSRRVVAREGDMMTSVMLGPRPLAQPDGCGYVNEVDVFIDESAGS